MERRPRRCATHFAPASQACKAQTLDAVVIATDDERVAEVCRASGARVVMTHPDCANGEGRREAAAAAPAPLRGLGRVAGATRATTAAAPAGTERCEEAVRQLDERYDIVINIQARPSLRRHHPTPRQAPPGWHTPALTTLTPPPAPQGDEPLIDPHTIDAVVRALQNAPDAVYRCGGGGGVQGRGCMERRAVLAGWVRGASTCPPTHPPPHPNNNNNTPPAAPPAPPWLWQRYRCGSASSA